MFQDLYDYLYHQADQGGIPLKGTGIVLGLLLVAPISPRSCTRMRPRVS